MARKKEVVSHAEQTVLEALQGRMKDDVEDWGAQIPVDWQSLLGNLVVADAGLMFRAADQQRAVAVGFFVAGQSVWQTCRTGHELAGYLDSVNASLDELAGNRRAARATVKGQGAAKKG